MILALAVSAGGPFYKQPDPNRKVIAITFDDGPHATHTDRILTELGKRNVKATFYVIGNRVKRHADLVERIVREGHEIGNHTWTHPKLTDAISRDVLGEQIRTQQAITEVCGVTPATLRAPYGALSERIRGIVPEQRIVGWSVDPQGWRHKDAGIVTEKVLEQARNGAVVLLHDIHGSTADAVPGIVDALREQGYEFVTVSELFGFGPAPGDNLSAPRPPTVNSQGIEAGTVRTFDGIEFVFCPAGTFEMGSSMTPDEVAAKYGYEIGYPEMSPAWFDREQPRHRVGFSRPFWLSKCEITKAQWAAVMGSEPWQKLTHVSDDPSAPAVNLSWNDVVSFISRLSETSSGSYRLPTEAEWEYACRAGSDTEFCFGDDAEGLDDYASYAINSWNLGAKSARAVGRKKPNAWGFHDMHGNVWEWCADWYDGNYYVASPPNDPAGPARGSCRVMRGGGWLLYPWHCRSAFRRGNDPRTRGINIGFRLCRDVGIVERELSLPIEE